MPADPEPLPLAAEFPAASRPQWRALAAAALRRAGLADTGDGDGDPEQTLSSTSYDGIGIAPFYTPDDVLASPGNPGQAPFVRGAAAVGATAAGWDVRVRHADPDASRTNASVLADLAGGATSLWLVLGEAGLPVEQLPEALAGVALDAVPIALNAGGRTREAATALLALAGQHGVAAAGLTGTLGADPIGWRARSGEPVVPALLGELAELAACCPQLRIATVDATGYHDAGARDVQELGIATAVGVAYLRALTDAGLPVEAALAATEFRFAITDDQFAGIAKLRAARRVWGRVAELCGAASGTPGQRQHAVTSAAMLTRRAPWVNMLRGTVACFAAAVGGAAAITVLPFDHAVGRPDDFARRVARNTATILTDESSLARVLDAAGGSCYVESLTDALAVKAWEQFTAIERAGGALAYLDSGRLSDDLAATRQRRDADIAHRRAPITGVSEFAFLDEQPLTRPPAASRPGAGPIAPHRYAEPFEALRDRAEATPTRPSVFLAGLGSAAVHSARAGFAANLFAAGGIRSVACTGGTEAVVAAFRESGSTLACLCSSDTVDADTAADVASALRAAGARQVWLVGTIEIPGVDKTIFAGCDALAALNAAYDVLEGAA